MQVSPVILSGQRAIRHLPDLISDAGGVISDRRSVIRCRRTSSTCMQEGVRVHPVAIRKTLARIRSHRPSIRFLPASIRCMPEGVRVHRAAIRETLARIRSDCPPIHKRQGHVQDKCREHQQRIEEFCVQREQTR